LRPSFPSSSLGTQFLEAPASSAVDWKLELPESG
jgi:hypothetical protein